LPPPWLPSRPTTGSPSANAAPGTASAAPSAATAAVFMPLIRLPSHGGSQRLSRPGLEVHHSGITGLEARKPPVATYLQIEDRALAEPTQLIALEAQTDLYSAPSFNERLLGTVEQGKPR